jgi:hypothetical protein
MSTDGINWTITFTRRFDSFTGVAYGNSRYVVVDSDHGDSLESTDAVHWAFYPATTSGLSWGGVAFGDGTFVAFDGNGSGELGTTVEGFGWFLQSYSPAQEFNGATFGCNSFVGVGQTTGSTNDFFSSPNSLSWSGVPVPIDGGDEWTSVAYGAHHFVAVNDSGDFATANSASVCGPTVPSAPQQVSGNIHNGEVWTYMHPSPSAGGAPITNYRVTISDGVTTKTCGAALSYEPNCIITGLQNRHVYEVTAQAHNKYGYSVPSDALFVIPVPSWTFKATTPTPVELSSSPFSIQVTGIAANSLGIYPVSLVTVQLGARTMSCHPSPFGECEFTVSDSTVGAATIHASYTGYGHTYASTTTTHLASVRPSTTSVSSGGQFTVAVAGGLPGTVAKASFGGRNFTVALNGAGSGVINVTAPASANSYDLAVSDDGVALSNTSISVG